MKWGVVPLSAVVKAGRMDAVFFLCPGHVQDSRAEGLERAAQKHLASAQKLRKAAEEEREAAAALGIVIHNQEE